MIPINTFLEIAKTFAAAVLKLAEVTTSVDMIYSAAKRVRSFASQKMRREPSGDTDGSSDLDDHDLS